MIRRLTCTESLNQVGSYIRKASHQGLQLIPGTALTGDGRVSVGDTRQRDPLIIPLDMEIGANYTANQSDTVMDYVHPLGTGCARGHKQVGVLMKDILVFNILRYREN